MESLHISKKVLCDFLIENGTDDIENLLNDLQKKYGLSQNQIEIVKVKLNQIFIPVFRQKWTFPNKNKTRFEDKFEKWLKSDLVIDFSEKKKIINRRSSDISFEDASASTKRRKLMEIEENYTSQEIQETFLRILRNSGRTKIAKAIIKMLNESDNCFENIKNEDECKLKPFSTEGALALMQDIKLSKFQYNILHLEAKMRNADIFPSYHNLLEAKKDCYPEEVQITETEARVNLQSSVNHLVERLLKSPHIVLSTEFSRQKKCNLELEIKYGCDGASGQSTFDQKFSDSNSSDESIFTVSMVPLCLRVTDTKEVIWMNPHPGSPKRCLPILLMLAKETTERTKKEMKMIDDEIKNLKETNVETSNGSYAVTVDMKLTMVDGKVCHALSDTPVTTNSYICGSKPTEMNNLKKVMKKPKNTENFQFGLSVLHAKIRFMECRKFKCRKYCA